MIVVASIVTILVNLGFIYVYVVFLKHTGHAYVRNGCVVFPGPGFRVEYAPPLLATIISACVAGLLEELFFRGYLISRLKLWWGPAVSIGISAVIFGLAHYPQPTRMLSTVVAGIIFGAAFQFSKSIVPSTLAHGVGNALAIVILKHVLLSG